MTHFFTTAILLNISTKKLIKGYLSFKVLGKHTIAFLSFYVLSNMVTDVMNMLYYVLTFRPFSPIFYYQVKYFADLAETQ